MPPGRNIKQQLAVKKTVSKWKRNVGGASTGTANGALGAGQSQNQNFTNGGKKQSMVIAKNPPGTRNLNVRNDGGAQQGNYYNRNFV